MDTRRLLEELEEAVSGKAVIPVIHKSLVDPEEVTRIVDAINASLPNELDNAKRVVAEKEIIIMDAQKQAENIIAQAKDYIAKITEESELVRAAQERADEIVAAAQKSADDLQQSALVYATDVLKYVEGNMEGTLDALRKNRESLMQQNRMPSDEQHGQE